MSIQRRNDRDLPTEFVMGTELQEDCVSPHSHPKHYGHVPRVGKDGMTSGVGPLLDFVFVAVY